MIIVLSGIHRCLSIYDSLIQIMRITFYTFLVIVLLATSSLAQRRVAPKSRPTPQQQKSTTSPPTTQPQATKPQSTRQVGNTAATTVRIRWSERPGIKRYRLQVASDEQFNDIVFDNVVEGNDMIVPGLAGGRYFWRVAPAAAETGNFSRPQPVQVVNAGGSAAIPEPPSSLIPIGTQGWRTATGEIARPIAAPLRNSTSLDLVGINAEGLVYALDGGNGVNLWTARYRPQAKRGESTGNGGGDTFTPLILNSNAEHANVVVAFDGGVRALDGASGRELWRARILSRPVSGLVADLDGAGAPEVVIVTREPAALIILNSATGEIINHANLSADAAGAPVAFKLGEARGLALTLEGGALEMRDASGTLLRSIKLDTGITTPPLYVPGTEHSIILIGTENGLISFDANDLKPLGRIATEGDAPRGTLVARDMNGDGAAEVVMITRRGRVVVVGTLSGKIIWYNAGAIDAESAAFVDLNNDGLLDVVVAGGPAFAIGFNGRDGTLIWKAEEATHGPATDTTVHPSRVLAITQAATAPLAFVVGTDPARVGLRAIGLQQRASNAAK